MQIVAIDIERQHVDLIGNAGRQPVRWLTLSRVNHSDRITGGISTGSEMAWRRSGVTSSTDKDRVAVEQKAAPAMMHQQIGRRMQVRPSCELISTDGARGRAGEGQQMATIDDRLPRIRRTG